MPPDRLSIRVFIGDGGLSATAGVATNGKISIKDVFFLYIRFVTEMVYVVEVIMGG